MRLIEEAFTKMITIFADDPYSQQAISITPAEARELRDLLNAADLDSNEFQDRESQHLRLLTLYNGHCLPSIDRKTAADYINLIGPRFYFEVWQCLDNGESKQVGEL
jgi:hypothetical protein